MDSCLRYYWGHAWEDLDVSVIRVPDVKFPSNQSWKKKKGKLNSNHRKTELCIFA